MGFRLNSALYDKIKSGVLVWIPAFSTFYFAVGTIWNFPAVDKVTGTLAALATFLGVTLGISKTNYVNSGDAFDGTMLITQDVEEGLSINVDMRGSGDAILEKDQIVLKPVRSYLGQPPGIDVSTDDHIETNGGLGHPD